MNIPAGWKLVPVEPTEEMLAATSWPRCAGSDYQHMLDAAPTPPAQQDDEALEVLKLAFDALTCGETGDDLEDSHRCGKCDEYVDRNAPVRQRIRAFIAKRGEK